MNQTNITRLTIDQLGDFAQDYQRQQQPVVIKDLFANQLISQLDSIAKAQQKLGTEAVRMRPNYIAVSQQSIIDYHRGKKINLAGESRESDFNGFFATASKEPEKNWIVTESPTPQCVLDDLDMSPLGIDNIVSGYGSAKTIVPTTSHSLMFLANTGNASDLHTDWDGRDVILYQASGVKRVTLFPPEAAIHLMPIEIFSTVKLNGMPEHKRQALVESLGGYDFLLQPGEAVFMPAFFWHHLEYVEQGLSFNFRFGGTTDPEVLFLMMSYHRDMYTQNLLAKFVADSESPEHREAINTMRDAYHKNYANPRVKYRELTKLSQQLYQQICDPNQSHYTWINCTDFLDGLLHFNYLRPDPNWHPVKKARWVYTELFRSFIRRMAFRLAHWA